MTEDEGERVETAYGSSYARLVDVKNTYDPTNLFRMNQNVAPTVG
jgi:FAD/FMN-containing dehydrogenase